MAEKQLNPLLMVSNVHLGHLNLFRASDFEFLGATQSGRMISSLRSDEDDADAVDKRSFVAAKTTPTLKAFGCCWHEGFYDTQVRIERQFHYLTDYIHDNPVRAGLVAKPEEWSASSAQSYSWVRLTW